MDANTFWSAAGAIGQWAGAIATVAAVWIAVRQGRKSLDQANKLKMESVRPIVYPINASVDRSFLNCTAERILRADLDFINLGSGNAINIKVDGVSVKDKNSLRWVTYPFEEQDTPAYVQKDQSASLTIQFKDKYPNSPCEIQFHLTYQSVYGDSFKREATFEVDTANNNFNDNEISLYNISKESPM